MSGIYIHIPFCKQACTYCDFHFSINRRIEDRIIGAMLLEIERESGFLKGKNIETIYFGGGTPSILKRESLDKLFEKLRKTFDLSKVKEITLECNPDDINEENIKNWKANGVNRLSIGIQSFNNEELRWMNRSHKSQDIHAKVKLAQDFGFSNISIDLIYGSKFQNENLWHDTINKVLELNIQHISAYNLTIEKKTKLGLMNKRGLEPNINEELSLSQFNVLQESLEKSGFIHYEISNFAKEGFISQHNSSYWKNKSYLGIGPSAHSYNGIVRRYNCSSNSKYCQLLESKLNTYSEEKLSLDDKYNEYILTGIRTIWGCDLVYIESNFGEHYKSHATNIVQKEKKNFIIQDAVFKLNKNGKALSDYLTRELMI
ncbi:MAG: radical SAM family heme chaperone HemW [Bacteroidia bacterium]